MFSFALHWFISIDLPTSRIGEVVVKQSHFYSYIFFIGFCSIKTMVKYSLKNLTFLEVVFESHVCFTHLYLYPGCVCIILCFNDI